MTYIRLFNYPFPQLPELGLIGTAELQTARQGLIEHEHGPCMEIVVFDRGRNTYAAEGIEYQMTGGDFFASPPRLIHSSGGNPQDKVRLAWTQIDLSPPRKHRRNSLPFLGLAGGEILRQQLAALPVVKGRATTTMYPQLLELFALTKGHVQPVSQTRHPARPPRLLPTLTLIDLRARLVRFLLEFLTVAHAAHSPGASTTFLPAEAAVAPSHTPLIAQALDYMQANITVPLSVTHIARTCGYSASAFKQAFRRQTGLSPADYFLRLKIDEAKRRLAAGDVSVTMLAHDLGFSSGQYFATAFRRLTTQTPSAYRARQR